MSVIHSFNILRRLRFQQRLSNCMVTSQRKWTETTEAFMPVPYRPMSSAAEYEHLSVTCEDGLRVITYNRPEKKNAINEKMMSEIPIALEEAAQDPNTLVTAVTGAGEAFCAGNDLNNFKTMAIGDISTLLSRCIGAFIDFPKPLVAVVNGVAVGGGLTLLALYDAVYATDKATFFTPFSSLRLSPEGCSSYTFPVLMGHAKAAELLMFDKRISAAEAFNLGLVTEVFPDDTFHEEVWPKVKAMTKLPVKSLIHTKQLMREIHRANLHQVNINECNRVAERMVAMMRPDEEYEKFASALPPLPPNTGI